MSSLKEKSQGKAYWRSLAERAETPAFRKQLEKEFPDVSLESMGSFSRRRFMQLMGASLALASGTAACRWPQDHLLPFTRRPTGRTPGVAQRYATSMELGGCALGLWVTSYDGRPIKVEGNPEHPASCGATHTFAQASILELYDPDRSQSLRRKSAGFDMPQGWPEFAETLRAWMAQAHQRKGQGLCVISEGSSSLSLARLRRQLLENLPQAQWVAYEPLSRDNERKGTEMLFGAPHRSHLRLDQAQVIVAIEDDILGTHPNSVRYIRDFTQSRRPDLQARSSMNRLYVAESLFSCTGAMADHRLALRASHINDVLIALTSKVLKQPGIRTPAGLEDGWATVSPAFLRETHARPWIDALARDLVRHAGRSVISVGAGQPPQVHALAHQLNHILGNMGHTVLYSPEPDPQRPTHMEALVRLCDRMHQGQVETLIILGGNPVFNAPGDVSFRKALAQVPHTAHLSLYQDETSALCHWHLPRAHGLESWGDSRAYDGTIGLMQPLIEPLYGGKTPEEVVAMMLGQESLGQDITRRTLRDLWGAGLDESKHWKQAVHRGFIQDTAWPMGVPTCKPFNTTPSQKPASAKSDLEITFWQDPHVYDGRFANNGWLQELPDFMTKLTWDNAAVFSPGTAAKLGVGHQTLVKIQYQDSAMSLTLPAYVLPGQAEGSVAVFLGYGRTEAGHVGGTQTGGVASVGFDTYRLYRAQAENFATDVSIEATGKFYALAITQDHHSLDELAWKGTQARVDDLVRQASLKTFSKNPHVIQDAREHSASGALWKELTYDQHRWGMAIDLTKCVGCNACVVACQAENNVPIVGKDQVIRGREMHWIRVDRYFKGTPQAPEAMPQVMLCQHCENAPCEQVCPVAATVHSSEGLNDMVYNRCVGTRYCSNNCPYKVRRFNFFNYHKNLEQDSQQVAKMLYNPEVTVRARGVMEKCTYCVQRIQNVKIQARNARRRIEDGEIMPACAQACPAGAIVFGDLNDPSSHVAQHHADPRSYAVLEELNTKPRTTYLARIKNPNPDL